MPKKRIEQLVLISPNSLVYKNKIKSHGQIIIKEFSDGESYIRMPGEFSGKSITLIHRCYPDQDKSLIQLLLILQTLKNHGAAFLRVIIPYLPYSRKNKIYLRGEVLSSNIICRLLRTSGCDELITIDCHFLKNEGKFRVEGLNLINLSVAPALIRYLKNTVKAAKVIAPDEGAAIYIQNEPNKGVMKKTRGPYTRSRVVHREPELTFDFSVAGVDVIIIDDIIGTGSTMLKAVRACKKKGAKSIACGAAHGLFLDKAIDELRAEGVNRIVSSDSVDSPFSKISIFESLNKLFLRVAFIPC